MTEQDKKILTQAIARNGGAVLSLPQADSLRHCKSRLLALQEDGVLLQAVPEEKSLVQSLIAAAADCTVAFKDNLQKVGFVTKILRAIPQWQTGDSPAVDALLVANPEQIKVVQRRTSYRAKVADGTGLRVRVWWIEEWAYLKDLPPRNQEINCEVYNLSVGGLGVRLADKAGKAPLVTSAHRLRIQLNLADQTLILEGRVRDKATAAGRDSLVTGIAFKKLERDVEGRQILSQITSLIGELQREELRLLRERAAQVG